MWGLPEQPVEAISIRNATFTSERGAKLFNVAEYELENVAINTSKGVPITTYQATGNGAEAIRK